MGYDTAVIKAGNVDGSLVIVGTGPVGDVVETFDIGPFAADERAMIKDFKFEGDFTGLGSGSDSINIELVLKTTGGADIILDAQSFAGNTSGSFSLQFATPIVDDTDIETLKNVVLDDVQFLQFRVTYSNPVVVSTNLSITNSIYFISGSFKS